MTSTKQVGRSIRITRLERGQSPEQFGANVGITGQTIRRLERGQQKRLRPRTMFLLANEVGVPVQELFDL